MRLVVEKFDVRHLGKKEVPMDLRNKVTFSLLGFAFLGSVAQAAFLPVCQRTPAVKKFLEQTLKKPCDKIEAADLLTVKRLSTEDDNVTAFQADDFTGLANLEILNIRSGQYTHLPEGLFKDLVHLKTLVIIDTKLRHYPDDFLAYNPEMEFLHVFVNQVRSISESVLQRLENMRHLKEVDFDQALLPAEKDRLRRRFPEGGVPRLSFF
jgi:hypothetical protein